MSVVAEDLVVQYLNLRRLCSSDSGLSVVAYVVVLLDSSEVLITLKYNSVLHVLLDPVVLYDCIRTKSVLGLDIHTTGVTASDFIHYDVRIRTDGVDTYLALDELAQLYSGSTSPLNFDPRSVDVIE